MAVRRPALRTLLLYLIGSSVGYLGIARDMQGMHVFWGSLEQGSASGKVQQTLLPSHIWERHLLRRADQETPLKREEPRWYPQPPFRLCTGPTLPLSAWHDDDLAPHSPLAIFAKEKPTG